MSASHVAHTDPFAAFTGAAMLGPDLPPHLADQRRRADLLWLPVSAELTDAVVAAADRDDILVTAVAATASGASANFIVPRAVIEVDRATFGTVDPATLRPARPGDRYRYPAAFGALVHEAAHAAHSNWSAAAIGSHATRPVREAAELLEEARVEAAQVARRPDDRLWLRAAVTTLVWPDLDTRGITTRHAAAQAAALVLARAEAGVLETEEVESVRKAVAEVLGVEDLDQLAAIWRSALRVADDDASGMLAAGEAWCRVVGIEPDPAAPTGARDPIGAGERAAARRGAFAALGAALDSAVDQVVASVRTATADLAAVATAEAEAEIRAEMWRRHAIEVFASHHAGTGRRGASPIAGTRVPTAAERGAASALAKALEAAATRERSTTVTASELPPGRLRMRGALSRDAQRAAGALPTAKPFASIARRHTPRPPLRVGIAVDVSSSMREVTAPMASAAWILSRAVAATGNDSKTATVAFGSTVTAITRPGVSAARVTEFRARCRTEQFTGALRALDLELGLSRPGAARLLVVVSDGQFTEYEKVQGLLQVRALLDAGCAVLWFTLDRARPARAVKGISFLTMTDPATAATEIGRAAVTVLSGAR